MVARNYKNGAILLLCFTCVNFSAAVWSLDQLETVEEIIVFKSALEIALNIYWKDKIISLSAGPSFYGLALSGAALPQDFFKHAQKGPKIVGSGYEYGFSYEQSMKITNLNELADEVMRVVLLKPIQVSGDLGQLGKKSLSFTNSKIQPAPEVVNGLFSQGKKSVGVPPENMTTRVELSYLMVRLSSAALETLIFHEESTMTVNGVEVEYAIEIDSLGLDIISAEEFENEKAKSQKKENEKQRLRRAQTHFIFKPSCEPNP